MATVVQRAGGTTTMPADELNERLEEMAASVEGGASLEATSFQFECLSSDTPSVLGILSDMLQCVPQPLSCWTPLLQGTHLRRERS